MTYIDMEAAWVIRTQAEINLLQRDVVPDCVPAADVKFVNSLHMEILLRKLIYSRGCLTVHLELGLFLN
jgi:hypothetical protein